MDKKAKYIQIRDFVAMEIIHNHIHSGDKLFTKTFFINKFKVNPKYVDKAYDRMIKENIIEAREDNYYLKFDNKKKDELTIQFANEYINELMENMQNIGLDKNNIAKMLLQRLKANG